MHHWGLLRTLARVKLTTVESVTVDRPVPQLSRTVYLSRIFQLVRATLWPSYGRATSSTSQAGAPLATASSDPSTLPQGVYNRVPLHLSQQTFPSTSISIPCAPCALEISTRSSRVHPDAFPHDAKGQLRSLHAAEDVQAIDCSWKGSYLRTRPGSSVEKAPRNGTRERPRYRHGFRVRERTRSVRLGQAEVWGWGWNEHGNRRLTGSMSDVKAPVRI